MNDNGGWDSGNIYEGPEKIIEICLCGMFYNDPSTNIQVLIHGKWDFTNMVQLKILDGEIILNYLGDPNVIIRVLIQGKQ